MKLTTPAAAVATALSVALLAAVWFSHAADLAMDKSGVGDLGTWRTESSRAELCYAVFAVIWLVSLASSFALAQPARVQLRLVCIASAVLLPVGLFSWMFLW